MEVFWSSSSSSASNEAGAKLLLVQVFCGQGVLCRVLLDSSFAMETSEWHVFQAASSKSWPRGRPLPHGLHVVLPFLLDGGSKFELEFCWTALKVKKRLGGLSFWYCLKAGVDEGGKMVSFFLVQNSEVLEEETWFRIQVVNFMVDGVTYSSSFKSLDFGDLMTKLFFIDKHFDLILTQHKHTS